MIALSLNVAREIVAQVAPTAKKAGRLLSLVEKMTWLDGLGDCDGAGRCVSKIDDLAGHYRDGQWVGGRTIAHALCMVPRHEIHAAGESAD